METTQILLNQYTQLPKNLQMEVLHFVEFLSTKVESKLESKHKSEEELNDEQKATLVERYKALELNPARGMKWQDAKQHLFNKYQKKVTI